MKLEPIITCYAIREIGTHNYIPFVRGFHGRTRTTSNSPVNPGIKLPRLYKTRQGATFAMNYYLGKVNTMVSKALSYGIHSKPKLEVVGMRLTPMDESNYAKTT